MEAKYLLCNGRRRRTGAHLDERAVLLGPQQRGAHEVGGAAARHARTERLHQRRAHHAELDALLKETIHLHNINLNISWVLWGFTSFL